MLRCSGQCLCNAAPVTKLHPRVTKDQSHDKDQGHDPEEVFLQGKVGCKNSSILEVLDSTVRGQTRWCRAASLESCHSGSQLGLAFLTCSKGVVTSVSAFPMTDSDTTMLATLLRNDHRFVPILLVFIKHTIETAFFSLFIGSWKQRPQQG